MREIGSERLSCLLKFVSYYVEFSTWTSMIWFQILPLHQCGLRTSSISILVAGQICRFSLAELETLGWDLAAGPPGSAFKVRESLQYTFSHLLFLSPDQKKDFSIKWGKVLPLTFGLCLDNRADTERREAKGPFWGLWPSFLPSPEALTTCLPSLSVSI